MHMKGVQYPVLIPRNKCFEHVNVAKKLTKFCFRKYIKNNMFTLQIVVI